MTKKILALLAALALYVFQIWLFAVVPPGPNDRWLYSISIGIICAIALLVLIALVPGDDR